MRIFGEIPMNNKKLQFSTDSMNFFNFIQKRYRAVETRGDILADIIGIGKTMIIFLYLNYQI
jgi:hypothetical protein